MVKAWFIVAIMSGVYTDGTKDIFIFKHPVDHGHFHNAYMCNNFIGDNPPKIAKALVNQYGARPPERIACVPEETVEMFMEAGGKRGEKT